MKKIFFLIFALVCLQTLQAQSPIPAIVVQDTVILAAYNGTNNAAYVKDTGVGQGGVYLYDGTGTYTLPNGNGTVVSSVRNSGIGRWLRIADLGAATSYNSLTQINDSTYLICKPNGSCDTIHVGSGGGGGVNDKFGYPGEDISSDTDRDFDALGHYLSMDNFSQFYARARVGNDAAIINNVAGSLSLTAGNYDVNRFAYINISQDSIIQFNTGHNDIPPYFVIQAIDSLNVAAPTRIAVWDADTLKSADFIPNTNIVDTANIAVAATTEALPAVTYNNGTGGVGATLTADANGALPPIDDVSLPVGSKLLVKNETSQEENGFFIVTDAGSPSTPFVLTRADNADETSELYPELIAVSSGTVNGGFIFQQTTVAPVVGTDNLIYVLFFVTQSGVQSVTGLNTDNTDPQNPIVKISVDSVTVFGDGTPGNPLSAVGSGGGSVASFGANDITGFATASVANATTNPVLTYNLINTGPHTVWGRATGVGAPSYLSSLDSQWIPTLHSENYYNTKYSPIWTLTTIGTSGAATYSGNVLNIPNYANTTYTGSNGITLSGTDFQWRGTLTQNSTITGAGFYSAFSGGRLEAGQGVAVVAANDLTLGSDGNAFSVTGATQINAITTSNWQAGSVVHLIFASTPTVKNNTAGGAGTAKLLLIGGTDFTAAVNDVSTFLYDGTVWHETARKLASAGGSAALNATQIGFGSASNLLTGIDSLTYSATNRLITTTNSQAGATFAVTSSSTIQGQNALILQNTAPATSTITGLSSPLAVFRTSAYKSGGTPASHDVWWGMGAVGVTGVNSVGSAFQFYTIAGLSATPSGMNWEASLGGTGTWTTQGNMIAGGTGGTGSFQGSTLDATLTSGTGINIISSNAAGGKIHFKFSGQEVGKFNLTTGAFIIQNYGTIPADPADGSHFLSYQNSSTTGIGSCTGTGGTAALTGNGSKFSNQAQKGDQVAIGAPNAETLTILSILDDTHITFTTNMANSHTNAGYFIIPATARKNTFYQNGKTALVGTPTDDAAAAGYVGEEINSTVSTYTNYTTTATYQNITSIALTPGDWDISAFFTYSSNSATITAASNAVFVISTTTASAAGATEGLNIDYLPQAALLGTSKFSDGITPYRVSLEANTTYYLNTQATFTLGNPQYVGSIRARRIR